jgi:hypothetical protein
MHSQQHIKFVSKCVCIVSFKCIVALFCRLLYLNKLSIVAIIPLVIQEHYVFRICIHFLYLHILMFHLSSNVYSLRSWMAVCLSLHGIVSGLQSQTWVSILISTAVNVICYARRLKDMKFTRVCNRRTVGVNSTTSLPSLFPVHSSVLPIIPYQSNYRPHMITASLLLTCDTGTNTSITGRRTDRSHGLCMMELLHILIPT